MIIDSESGGDPRLLEEYTPGQSPALRVLSNAIGEAVSDNPSTRLVDWAKIQSAGGKQLSKSEAQEIAKNAGVSVANIPDTGIRADALNIMIDRQYAKRERAEAISSVEDGWGKSALEIGGGLIGSLLDPINVGLSFIPFAGQGRYAAWMAAASHPLARLAGRGVYGGVQGGIGASLVETLNYPLAQEIGDDYTYTNSLMNIAFGGGLGAGLHATAGAVSDLIASRKRISQIIQELNPQTRLNLARTAVAQAVEDRPVNVNPVVKAEELAIKNKLLDLEVEKDRSYARDQRKSLESQLSSPSQPKVIDKASRTPELQNDIRQSLVDGSSVDLVIGDESVGLVEVTDNGFIDSQGGNWTTEDLIRALDEEGATLEINSPQDIFEPSTPENVREEVNAAQTDPDAHFIDHDLIEEQLRELSEIPKEMRVEEATAEMNEAVSLLQDELEHQGLKVEDIAEMEKATEEVKLASEYEKALNAYANCVMRNSP